MDAIELSVKNLLNERGLSESDLASIPGIGAEGAAKIPRREGANH